VPLAVASGGAYIDGSRRPIVSDDLPSDVETVLSQLLEETETALRTDEFETARQTVQTAATVSRNKLPESELRGQLLHGCGEVVDALEPADGVKDDVAAEYVRAMIQRVPESD